MKQLSMTRGSYMDTVLSRIRRKNTKTVPQERPRLPTKALGPRTKEETALIQRLETNAQPTKNTYKKPLTSKDLRKRLFPFPVRQSTERIIRLDEHTPIALVKDIDKVVRVHEDGAITEDKEEVVAETSDVVVAAVEKPKQINNKPVVTRTAQKLALSFFDPNPSLFRRMVMFTSGGNRRPKKRIQELLKKHMGSALRIIIHTMCWMALLWLVGASSGIGMAFVPTILQKLVKFDVGEKFKFATKALIKSVLRQWVTEGIGINHHAVFDKKLGPLPITLGNVMEFALGTGLDTTVDIAVDLVPHLLSFILAPTNVAAEAAATKLASMIPDTFEKRAMMFVDKYMVQLESRLISTAVGALIVDGDIVDGLNKVWNTANSVITGKPVAGISDKPMTQNQRQLKNKQWWLAVAGLLGVFGMLGVQGDTNLRDYLDKAMLVPMLMEKTGSNRLIKAYTTELFDWDVFKKPVLKRSSDEYWGKYIKDHFFGKIFTKPELLRMNREKLVEMVNGGKDPGPKVTKAKLVKAFLKQQESKLAVTLELMLGGLVQYHLSGMVRQINPMPNTIFVDEGIDKDIQEALKGDKPAAIDPDDWKTLSDNYNTPGIDAKMRIDFMNQAIGDGILDMKAENEYTVFDAKKTLKAFVSYQKYKNPSTILYSPGMISVLRQLYHKSDFITGDAKTMEMREGNAIYAMAQRDLKSSKVAKSGSVYADLKVKSMCITTEQATIFYKLLLTSEMGAGIPQDEWTKLPPYLTLGKKVNYGEFTASQLNDEASVQIQALRLAGDNVDDMQIRFDKAESLHDKRKICAEMQARVTIHLFLTINTGKGRAPDLINLLKNELPEEKERLASYIKTLGITDESEFKKLLPDGQIHMNLDNIQDVPRHEIINLELRLREQLFEERDALAELLGNRVDISTQKTLPDQLSILRKARDAFAREIQDNRDVLSRAYELLERPLPKGIDVQIDPSNIPMLSLTNGFVMDARTEIQNTAMELGWWSAEIPTMERLVQYIQHQTRADEQSKKNNSALTEEFISLGGGVDQAWETLSAAMKEKHITALRMKVNLNNQLANESNALAVAMKALENGDNADAAAPEWVLQKMRKHHNALNDIEQKYILALAAAVATDKMAHETSEARKREQAEARIRENEVNKALNAAAAAEAKARFEKERDEFNAATQMLNAAIAEVKRSTKSITDENKLKQKTFDTESAAYKKWERDTKNLEALRKQYDEKYKKDMETFNAKYNAAKDTNERRTERSVLLQSAARTLIDYATQASSAKIDEEIQLSADPGGANDADDRFKQFQKAVNEAETVLDSLGILTSLIPTLKLKDTSILENGLEAAQKELSAARNKNEADTAKKHESWNLRKLDAEEQDEQTQATFEKLQAQTKDDQVLLTEKVDELFEKELLGGGTFQEFINTLAQWELTTPLSANANLLQLDTSKVSPPILISAEAERDKYVYDHVHEEQVRAAKEIEMDNQDAEKYNETRDVIQAAKDRAQQLLDNLRDPVFYYSQNMSKEQIDMWIAKFDEVKGSKNVNLTERLAFLKLQPPSVSFGDGTMSYEVFVKQTIGMMMQSGFTFDDIDAISSWPVLSGISGRVEVPIDAKTFAALTTRTTKLIKQAEDALNAYADKDPDRWNADVDLILLGRFHRSQEEIEKVEAVVDQLRKGTLYFKYEEDKTTRDKWIADFQDVSTKQGNLPERLEFMKRAPFIQHSSSRLYTSFMIDTIQMLAQTDITFNVLRDNIAAWGVFHKPEKSFDSFQQSSITKIIAEKGLVTLNDERRKLKSTGKLAVALDRLNKGRPKPRRNPWSKDDEEQFKKRFQDEWDVNEASKVAQINNRIRTMWYSHIMRTISGTGVVIPPNKQHIAQFKKTYATTELKTTRNVDDAYATNQAWEAGIFVAMQAGYFPKSFLDTMPLLLDVSSKQQELMNAKVNEEAIKQKNAKIAADNEANKNRYTSEKTSRDNILEANRLAGEKADELMRNMKAFVVKKKTEFDAEMKTLVRIKAGMITPTVDSKFTIWTDRKVTVTHLETYLDNLQKVRETGDPDKIYEFIKNPPTKLPRVIALRDSDLQDKVIKEWMALAEELYNMRLQEYNDKTGNKYESKSVIRDRRIRGKELNVNEFNEQAIKRISEGGDWMEIDSLIQHGYVLDAVPDEPAPPEVLPTQMHQGKTASELEIELKNWQDFNSDVNLMLSGFGEFIERSGTQEDVPLVPKSAMEWQKRYDQLSEITDPYERLKATQELLSYKPITGEFNEPSPSGADVPLTQMEEKIERLNNTIDAYNTFNERVKTEVNAFVASLRKRVDRILASETNPPLAVENYQKWNKHVSKLQMEGRYKELLDFIDRFPVPLETLPTEPQHAYVDSIDPVPKPLNPVFKIPPIIIGNSVVYKPFLMKDFHPLDPKTLIPTGDQPTQIIFKGRELKLQSLTHDKGFTEYIWEFTDGKGPYLPKQGIWNPKVPIPSETPPPAKADTSSIAPMPPVHTPLPVEDDIHVDDDLPFDELEAANRHADILGKIREEEIQQELQRAADLTGIQSGVAMRIATSLESLGITFSDVLGGLRMASEILGLPTEHIRAGATDAELTEHFEDIQRKRLALEEECEQHEAAHIQAHGFYRDSLDKPSSDNVADLVTYANSLRVRTKAIIEKIGRDMKYTLDEKVYTVSVLQQLIILRKQHELNSITSYRDTIAAHTGEEPIMPGLQLTLTQLMEYRKTLEDAVALLKTPDVMDFVEDCRVISDTGFGKISVYAFLIASAQEKEDIKQRLKHNEAQRTAAFLRGQLAGDVPEQSLSSLWKLHNLQMRSETDKNKDLVYMARVIGVPIPDTETEVLSEIRANNKTLEQAIRAQVSSVDKEGELDDILRTLLAPMIQQLGVTWDMTKANSRELMDMYLRAKKESDFLTSDGDHIAESRRKQGFGLLLLLPKISDGDLFRERMRKPGLTPRDINFLVQETIDFVATALEREKDNLVADFNMDTTGWGNMTLQQRRGLIDEWKNTNHRMMLNDANSKIEQLTQQDEYFKRNLREWYLAKAAGIQPGDVFAFKKLFDDLGNDMLSRTTIEKLDRLRAISLLDGLIIDEKLESTIAEYHEHGANPDQIASAMAALQPYVLRHFRMAHEKTRGYADPDAYAKVENLLKNGEKILSPDRFNDIMTARDGEFQSAALALKDHWNATEEISAQINRDLETQNGETAFLRAHLKVTMDINAPVPEKHVRVLEDGRIEILGLNLYFKGRATVVDGLYRITYADTLEYTDGTVYKNGSVEGYPLRYVDGEFHSRDYLGRKQVMRGKWTEEKKLRTGTITTYSRDGSVRVQNIENGELVSIHDVRSTGGVVRTVERNGSVEFTRIDGGKINYVNNRMSAAMTNPLLPDDSTVSPELENSTQVAINQFKHTASATVILNDGFTKKYEFNEETGLSYSVWNNQDELVTQITMQDDEVILVDSNEGGAVFGEDGVIKNATVQRLDIRDEDLARIIDAIKAAGGTDGSPRFLGVLDKVVQGILEDRDNDMYNVKETYRDGKLIHSASDVVDDATGNRVHKENTLENGVLVETATTTSDGSQTRVLFRPNGSMSYRTMLIPGDDHTVKITEENIDEPDDEGNVHFTRIIKTYEAGAEIPSLAIPSDNATDDDVSTPIRIETETGIEQTDGRSQLSKAIIDLDVTTGTYGTPKYMEPKWFDANGYPEHTREEMVAMTKLLQQEIATDVENIERLQGDKASSLVHQLGDGKFELDDPRVLLFKTAGPKMRLMIDAENSGELLTDLQLGEDWKQGEGRAIGQSVEKDAFNYYTLQVLKGALFTTAAVTVATSGIVLLGMITTTAAATTAATATAAAATAASTAAAATAASTAAMGTAAAASAAAAATAATAASTAAATASAAATAASATAGTGALFSIGAAVASGTGTLATGLSLADAIIQIHNTAGIQTTTSEDTTETEGDTTKITDILRNKLKLSEMLDSLQNTVKNRFNNYTPDKVAAGLFPGFDGKTKKKSKPPGTDSNRPDAQLLQGNEETLLMINNDKVRKVWENLGVTKRAGNEFDQQVKSLMKKSEGKLSLEDARKQFMEKRGKNAGLYMGKGIDQIGSNLIKVAEQTGDIPSGIMQSFNNLKAEVAHAVQTGDTGGIALAMKRLDVDYKHAYKRAEDLRLRKRSSLSPDEAKDLAFIENLKKREKGGISAEQAIADAKKSMRNGMDELGLRGVQFTPLPSGMLDASAHEEEFQRFKKGVIEWRNVFMAHAQAYLIQHILADPIHSMSKGLWEAVRDAKNYLAPEYKNTIVDHLLVGMLARGTTQMILANPTLPFKMGGYAVRGGKSLYQFGLTNGLRVAKHMAPNSQTAQRLNAANKALNAVPSEHAIRLAAYQKGLRTKLWNQRLKPFKDIEDRTSRFVYNHGGGFVMRVGKKAMTNKNVQVVIKYAPIGAQAVAVGLNTWTAYSAWKAMRTDPMYQEWEKVSTVHNLGITESLKLAYQADNMDLTKLPPPDPETNTFIRRLTDAEKKRATDLVTARMMGSIEKGVTFVEGYTGKIFSITRIDPQELEKAVNEEIAAQEQHKYLIEALRERVKNAIKAQAGIESRTKAEEPVAKDDGKPTAPSLLIPIWEQ